MMRMLRALTALCLALMMLCSAALADAPLLRYAADWQLEDTPIEVTLSAAIEAHMPYDDDRLAMLTGVTNALSLRLTANGSEEGSVTIKAGASDLLTLARRGNQVQLSSMPDTTFTSQQDPMEKLIGASSDTELSIYGVSAKSETLLTDGWAVMEKLISELEEKEFGTRKKNTTNVENMGKASFRLDAAIPQKRAGELAEMLMTACPEGWLREILGSLVFSGKQTFRIYLTAEGVPLRFEYNGTCGPEGEKRTVQLIWRAKRADSEQRDEITLTSPAKSGGNRNTLKFERITKASKKGTVTTEGEYSYAVKKDKQITEWKGSFDLKNVATSKSDVISGKATFQQKLPGEKNFTSLTVEPKLTIAGTQEEPDISGKIEVTEKTGKNVTEQVTITLALTRAAESAWQDAATYIDLDALTSDGLAQVQQTAAASVTGAIVRPLILLLGQEGDWFFHEMPDEAVQQILDAAGSTLVIE